MNSKENCICHSPHSLRLLILFCAISIAAPALSVARCTQDRFETGVIIVFEVTERQGFDPIEFEGVDVSLPASLPPFVGNDEATLQLRQWKSPFNGAPPYSPPVNHLGIDRIALYVEDLNAAIDEMNRLGFEQLGPIGGGANVGSIGIVFFYDPDRIKVELWGPVSVVPVPNPQSDC